MIFVNNLFLNRRKFMAKNILICDDAAFMRMMIKDILTKNGYNIAGEAENGQKAVEKYAELRLQILQHLLLCVLQWDSRLWLLNLYSQELRTLLLNHSRQTE